MSIIVEDSLAFAISLSFMVSVSLLACKKLSARRITAERAFWSVWVFLIISAEVVTSFDLFDYSYVIDSNTRRYTLEVFITCAIAFVMATFLVRMTGRHKKAEHGASCSSGWGMLTERRKALTSSVFLVVGMVEFASTYMAYGNLLDLRLASLEKTHSGFQIYLYFFYFAYAYLLLLGYLDSCLGRLSKMSVYMTITALVLHGLSVGGRINIVVAPIFYLVPYMLGLDINRYVTIRTYFNARRNIIKLLFFAFIVFSLVGLMRTFVVDYSSIFTLDGFIGRILLAVPKYISDSYISISVHVKHALSGEPQMGKYTFDGIYRVLMHFGLAEPVDQNQFGHMFYRDTSDPWAWTQVNMIPRFIVDFGEGTYLIPLFLIAFMSQWISIAFSGKGFI